MQNNVITYMYIIIDKNTKFESLVISEEGKCKGVGEGYIVGFSLFFFLKKSETDIATLKLSKEGVCRQVFFILTYLNVSNEKIFWG